MTKKYEGIIMLRPDRLTLTIRDDQQAILTQVKSGALRVGDRKSTRLNSSHQR